MAGSRSPNPPPSPSSSSSSISTPPEQLKVSQEKLEALAEARKEEEKEGRVVLGHEGAEEEEELPPGRSRCRWLDITIEPALFIGMFGAMLMSLIMQNLMLDKTCRVNLDYSDDICDALLIQNMTNNATHDAETEVQSYVAGINQWKFILDHAIPIFFCLVMGAWSDKHGRKPILCSAELGYFIGGLTLLLNTWQWEWPVEACVIMYGIGHSLGGASVMVNLGTLSYMSDVSPTETKTQRIGIAIMCYLLPTPISSAVGGPLFEAAGYYAVFGLAAALNFSAFLYLLIFVRESVKNTSQYRSTIFRDLFDFTQIYFSMKTLFRKREGHHQRFKVIVLVCLVFFSTFYGGEGSIKYLYTRYVFQWDISQYGLYSTYMFIINITGIAFTLGVVSHYLKVSDAMIGILGSISQVFASLCLTFSYKYGVWLLLVGPAIDFLNGAVTICNKSMLAKTVPGEELGQLAAVNAVIEALVPTIANPLYSLVYEKTFDTDFPGAAFLLTVAVMIVCIVAFTYLYIEGKMSSRRMRRAANEGSGAGDLPPPVRMISAIATTHDDINHPRGNKKSPQVNDEDTK